MVRALHRFLPALLPYFRAVYLGRTMPEMRAVQRKADGAAEDSTYTVLSQLGLQQGDPLGPLFFALAQTDALHPVGDTDGEAEECSASHVAYLDDTNLLLGQTVDELALGKVGQVISRLAGVGLEINKRKSLVIAKNGHTFSDAERALIDTLGIPYLDASVAAERRGFVTVGVPVGHPEFVHRQMQEALLNESFWRFAWHLRGMAENHFAEAYKLLSSSLARRCGFLARNVDPQIGAAWCAGFDSFCAWTFENILQLEGTVSATDMRRHLESVCRAEDYTEGCTDELLRMRIIGPAEGVRDLPLQVSRLQSGGFALPSMGKVCYAAHVAQLQVTLQPSMEAVMMAANSQTAPAGFADSSVMSGYRSALRALQAEADLRAGLDSDKPAEALDWALSEAPQVANDRDADALAAAMTERLQFNTTVPPAAPAAAVAAVQPQARPAHPGIQKRLTALLTKRHRRTLFASLQQRGAVGEACLAQIRSQSEQWAMSWVKPRRAQRSLTTMQSVSMVLLSLCVDVWQIEGDGCPYCKVATGPTATHTLMCSKFHKRGLHATHSGVKHAAQALVSRCNIIGNFTNEDNSMFTAPPNAGRRGKGRRMDTVLLPGALCNCGDDAWVRKGLLIDNTVRSPLVATLVSRAAQEDGTAASAGEAAKHTHYDGWYAADRWKLVPVVQETYGRMGKVGVLFFKRLATHSARCRGGTERQIQLRRVNVYADCRTGMSVALARELAERLCAYAYEAHGLGRRSSPASLLLQAPADDIPELD